MKKIQDIISFILTVVAAILTLFGIFVAINPFIRYHLWVKTDVYYGVANPDYVDLMMADGIIFFFMGVTLLLVIRVLMPLVLKYHD